MGRPRSDPRGLASIHLEGFSEDLNEDGYVDPVAQAVAAPVVQAAAPVAVAAAAPAAVYTQQYAQPALAYAAAPAYAAVPQQVAAYAAPAPQVVAQQAPALTYTVPHHQVAHTGLHAANVAVAPVAQVAGHAHGLCHNHLGSAVPCALYEDKDADKGGKEEKEDKDKDKREPSS